VIKEEDATDATRARLFENEQREELLCEHTEIDARHAEQTPNGDDAFESHAYLPPGPNV
jgi:hypothetical protein